MDSENNNSNDSISKLMIETFLEIAPQLTTAQQVPFMACIVAQQEKEANIAGDNSTSNESNS